MIRVGFTFNVKGKTQFSEAEIEWDTPETISAILQALGQNAEVVPIEADERAHEKLEREKPDIVFNYAEGVCGEERESEIPAILESLGLPYTGSTPATMKHCLNKAKAKELLTTNGVKTAEFVTVSSMRDGFPELSFPCIVKPIWEGSSKGIHNTAIVNDKNELRDRISNILNQYRQPALVEAFLPGREFTVAVLGNGHEARVLPVVEIDYSSLPNGFDPILSYEVKWVIDNPANPLKILISPAEIDEPLKVEIERTALLAYSALGCRDWCRIDIRLDADGNPNILELNPLPGLLPNPEDNSCLPAAARAEGLSFDDLVNEVLTAAMRRYGM